MLGFVTKKWLQISVICTKAGIPNHGLLRWWSKPTETIIREYGLRWGIESLFWRTNGRSKLKQASFEVTSVSDYKTRGFGLENTHLRRVDRISQLLLVLAISIYWAVVNGYQVQKKLFKINRKRKTVLALKPARSLQLE